MPCRLTERTKKYSIGSTETCAVAGNSTPHRRPRTKYPTPLSLSGRCHRIALAATRSSSSPSPPAAPPPVPSRSPPLPAHRQAPISTLTAHCGRFVALTVNAPWCFALSDSASLLRAIAADQSERTTELELRQRTNEPHNHRQVRTRGQPGTSNVMTAPSGCQPAPLPRWVTRSTRTATLGTHPGRGNARSIEIAL